MLNEALKLFVNKLGRSIFCILALAFDFVLLVILTNMTLAEFDKLAPFDVIKGKNGIFLQVGGNDWFGDDLIERMISENGRLISTHFSSCYCEDINGRPYTAKICANAELEYIPYIYRGVSYKNAEVPEGQIGVICSDNVAGIKPGMSIKNTDGITFYVTGVFSWEEPLLGNSGRCAYDVNSYEIVYEDFSEANEDFLKNTFENDMFLVGDYRQLKELGVKFNIQAYNFLIYPENVNIDVMREDAERISDYVKNNSAFPETPSYVMDFVPIAEFEKESGRFFFDRIGKLLPLALASVLILLSSLVCICFVNMQENERENAIRRMLGYKKRHIILLEMLQALLLIGSSLIVLFCMRFILQYFGVIKKYLAFNFTDIMIIVSLSVMVIIIYTLMPYLRIKKQTIADGLRIKEWS